VIFRDTVFKDVDTSAILRQFYALYSYERSWTDSLLTVTVKDVITQNKPLTNVFTYKILRPQTVVTNFVTNTSYSRYVAFGFSVPVKDLSLSTMDLMYVDRKWYGGVGYGKGGLSVKGGVTLFRMK
jgi:hypothetical protein